MPSAIFSHQIIGLPVLRRGLLSFSGLPQAAEGQVCRHPQREPPSFLPRAALPHTPVGRPGSCVPRAGTDVRHRPGLLAGRWMVIIEDTFPSGCEARFCCCGQRSRSRGAPITWWGDLPMHSPILWVSQLRLLQAESPAPGRQASYYGARLEPSYANS